MMRKLIRKLLLGTASVLALGIGGAALDYAADAGNGLNAATMPPAARTSDSSMTGDAFRKDDIRWAQVQLRDKGLYKGSLDGILGPETKRALGQFQKANGLGRTASLDAQTWEALTGDPSIGHGSSKPAAPERTERSNLGR
jgi:peptidoglycan hydrolase-like protein with peptidoglycan-binding domain